MLNRDLDVEPACRFCACAVSSKHLKLAAFVFSCFQTGEIQSQGFPEPSDSVRLGYVAAAAAALANERQDRWLLSGRADNIIKQKYFHYWTEAWVGLQFGFVFFLGCRILYALKKSQLMI